MSNLKITAPPFKATAVMSTSSYASAGWEESIWISDPTATDLATARTIAATWITKRMALSLSDVVCQRVRVWPTLQVYRGAGVLVPAAAGAVGTYVPSGSAEAETLPPSAKLLILSQNSIIALHNSDFLGGIPDIIVAPNGYYTPDTAFSTNMAAYISFLKASCSFVRMHGSPPVATAFAIDDVQIRHVAAERKAGRPFPSHRAMDMQS